MPEVVHIASKPRSVCAIRPGARPQYAAVVTLPMAGCQPAQHALVALLLLLLLLALPQVTAAQGQTLRDVVFGEYGEHSSNPETARRLLSPLTAARLERELAHSGRAVAAQPANLAAERFIVYLPSQQPARGFALVVFVPPWQDARVPSGWEPVLDRHGVIYVSAARCGNDEDVLGRREPLALLAAYNIMKRYPVDPERIYVAGFSGGSRIALRLALGYPDLFRGAILNAGSDPIGDRQIPLPPKDLFLRFQSSTHIVYVTGERDTEHLADDMASIHSLHKWCVANVDEFVLPRLAHEVADAAALDRALGELLKSAQPHPTELAACRSRVEAELEENVQKVQKLLAAGRRAAADKLLLRIDQRFGGLAAPRSIELATQ